jgi:hypothetical protein
MWFLYVRLVYNQSLTVSINSKSITYRHQTVEWANVDSVKLLIRKRSYVKPDLYIEYKPTTQKTQQVM